MSIYFGRMKMQCSRNRLSVISRGGKIYGRDLKTSGTWKSNELVNETDKLVPDKLAVFKVLCELGWKLYRITPHHYKIPFSIFLCSETGHPSRYKAHPFCYNTHSSRCRVGLPYKQNHGLARDSTLKSCGQLVPAREKSRAGTFQTRWKTTGPARDFSTCWHVISKCWHVTKF